MNPTMQKEIIEKFPEIVSLVQKLKELPASDLTHYRDVLLVSLIISTSNTDKEAFGTIFGLLMNLWEEFKIADKNRYFDV